MHLSWCIYQTGIVKETEKLTRNLFEKKMQHEKYSLISEPQDLIKNNDRVLTFP